MAVKGILKPEAVIARVDRLRGARGTLESHWQEIADFMIPRKDTFVRTRPTEGEKRNVQLLNSEAMNSGNMLAAALHSLLTNPSREFFSFTTGDAELDGRDAVRRWFQRTSRQMHLVMNNSNFQTEVHELYIDLVFFAISTMGIEEDPRFIVRFQTQHMDNVLIEENNKGQIDQLYVMRSWIAENIVREFGRENAGKDVVKAMEDGSSKQFEVIQAIYPRDAENFGVAERMGFVSQWILKQEKRNLRIKGFQEFPFVTPRWSKGSGEKYGRGPGMVALPDAKTINEMDRTILIGAQKTVDPPMQAPDDGFLMPIFTVPGGMNFFRAGTPVTDRISPILNDARVDIGVEVLRDRTERIRKAFHIDELRLRQGPQMTAQEVLQRTEDSMRILGPTLARLNFEFLTPLVDRVFNIMDRRGMIDDIPEEILEFKENTGRDVSVRFSSLIAKAQAISEAQAIDRTVQAAAPFLEMDPSAVDAFDAIEAIRSIARVHEPPVEIFRDDDAIKELRAARAEQQKKEQDAAETAQGVDNVSKLAPAAAQLRQA